MHMLSMESQLTVHAYDFTPHRVIRLTSPTLNYIIIVGSVLMYISVIFEVLPTTQEEVFHFLCIVSHDFDCTIKHNPFFQKIIYSL